MKTFLAINRLIDPTIPLKTIKRRKLERLLINPHSILNKAYRKQIVTK